MIVQYHRVRKDVSRPTRGHPSDAGLDVYFCPADRSTTVLRIAPGENKLLQTGLRFEVPHGYMLEVKNRSSVAATRGLIVGACVIDSGYAGEVFINLHNVGSNTQLIEPHTKIAQLVMLPVISFQALENEEGELYEYPVTISARGTNALGSTDEA
jgi:dUTP pyrophosphatase